MLFLPFKKILIKLSNRYYIPNKEDHPCFYNHPYLIFTMKEEKN